MDAIADAIRAAVAEAEARAREEERLGTRDILEDAEAILAGQEMHGEKQPPVVMMSRTDFTSVLADIRRARSMEDKDHE